MDGGLVLNQGTFSAGFFTDGSRANSVADAITQELEGTQSKALGVTMESDLDRGDYDWWA